MLRKKMACIVPQLSKLLGFAVFAMLGGCAGKPLATQLPPMPTTAEEARNYLAKRDAQLQWLDYEINQATRKCYEGFFVSDCVDAVRIEGNTLKRAHAKALGAANDILRMDKLYSKTP